MKDDPFNEESRKNLPGAQTDEAVDLERLAAELIAQQWGITRAPFIEDDPGFTKYDRRWEIYGAQPWDDLPKPEFALANDVLLLWAATAQNSRSFEHTFYLCLTANGRDRSGALTGLPVVKDMPCTDERASKEAKRTAKWIGSLLANPDYWPSAGGHALAHAPRLRQLRSIFLVEAKWTEPRYLIQPVMAARARAFSELDDTPSEYESLRQCDV